MKQIEFIELVSNPFNATSVDLKKLQDLKKQFPFFQSAHVLLSLVSKKYDSGVYQQTLRQTAISIPNRARLHALLQMSEEVASTQEIIIKEKQIVEVKKSEEEGKKVTEMEHLKAIELSSEKENKEEELNRQVEKEIQKDIVEAFIEKKVLKTNDWYKKEGKKIIDEPTKKVELKSGSFTDWLQALKKADRVGHESIKETERPTKLENQESNTQEDKKAIQKALIDKIIEINPSNIRLDPNQRFFAADTKAKESLIENEDLVTETLAKIYALQGNISKAVRAYEILSLKFPQKSAYFATLIQNLKKQNQ